MSKKHYIMTAITLGAIAAVSAGLIGLANLVTKDKIAKNEYNKTMSGIASIFGEKAEIEKEGIFSTHLIHLDILISLIRPPSGP